MFANLRFDQAVEPPGVRYVVTGRVVVDTLQVE